MTMETYTPDEAQNAVENLTEGDEFTVEYDSANAGEVTTKTLEATQVGESWNGKAWEIEGKNSDGIYKLTVSKDDGSATFERLQFEWQNGERSRKTGSRCMTRRAVDAKGVVGVTVEVEGEENTEREVETVEERQTGVHMVEFTDGYTAVVEEYTDAEGFRVTAGKKYVDESTHRQIENKMGVRVDA